MQRDRSEWQYALARVTRYTTRFSHVIYPTDNDSILSSSHNSRVLTASPHAHPSNDWLWCFAKWRAINSAETRSGCVWYWRRGKETEKKGGRYNENNRAGSIGQIDRQDERDETKCHSMMVILVPTRRICGEKMVTVTRHTIEQRSRFVFAKDLCISRPWRRDMFRATKSRSAWFRDATPR